MKMRKLCIVIVSLFFIPLGVVQATELAIVGKIQMIESYLPSSQINVRLEGSPSLAMPSCSGSIFTGSISDVNFMKVIYPVLLAAKTSSASIKIVARDCLGTMPAIVGTEY